MKLLIVDDQELILESLNIVLEMEEDIEVVGLAKNGQEAVDYSERYRPDVILMDINMPAMDGVKATEIIKKKYPEIKIIILTSYKEVDYVFAALSHGAEGYLLKAIHPKNLIAGIRVVHSGGTLISQDMAADFIQRVKRHDLSEHTEKTEENHAKNLPYGLSRREMDVLQKLAMGLRNQDIAQTLFLSEGTIKNYISNIYSKLNVKGRLEATQKARDAGLVSHKKVCD
ncbi:response regulator transcription factor [Paenibacillus silviterrae]|uniref:response regulator transcription factor n=1 Tax=Paenibacillus silviterrae TaxID=3242194 RepID=UPI0025437D5E|nr:response regulator transcription factor [Paenibacillus chinjuensis]